MDKKKETLTVTPKDALVLAKSYSDLNALVAFCKRRWAELNGGSVCSYPYPTHEQLEKIGIEWSDDERVIVLFFLDKFFNEWEENRQMRVKIETLKEKLSQFPKTVLGQTVIEK